MKAVILLGAPGAGKGTVAETIRAESPYIHVSTGDMLRAAVKAGTPVGLQAKGYMERGELVPDTVILGIVRERLQAGAADAKYLFDGFPRTEAQARGLDDLLAEFGSAVGAVFQLDVPRDVLISRIAGRRVCKQCGAVYHVKNIPTRVEGVCDRCGGPTYQRADDTEATVVNRLDVYERQTADLISYYESRGLLVRVDGTSRAGTEKAILERLGTL